MNQEVLDNDSVEKVYHDICAVMYLDLGDRQYTYEQQTPEEQQEMDTATNKIKRLIAKGRLSLDLEGTSVMYRLQRPIRNNNNEIQSVTFNVDSLNVEKLIKSQSNKNYSDAEKSRQMISYVFNLSILQTDKMFTKDYIVLGELMGFFMAA